MFIKNMESAPGNDDDVMVPCEFCEEMVELSEYVPHLQTCINQRLPNVGVTVEEQELQQNVEEYDHLVIVIALRLDGLDGLDLGESDDYEANLRLRELLGVVERGIQEFERVVESYLDSAPAGEICVICQSGLCSDERPKAVKLICGHCFCNECIGEWLRTKKRCPLCMVDLEEELAKKSTESVNKRDETQGQE